MTYENGCCEECWSGSQDVNFGRGWVAVPEGCKDEECECHDKNDPCDDRDAAYDSWKDDQLTEK